MIDASATSVAARKRKKKKKQRWPALAGDVHFTLLHHTILKVRSFLQAGLIYR